ncbi:hypothetical protein HanRHA438_Chr08g0330731 [Helianthus annuus]|nr:hypothetical protein HanRHA438_Chr08g0330731 [Helianthus annuus]
MGNCAYSIDELMETVKLGKCVVEEIKFSHFEIVKLCVFLLKLFKFGNFEIEILIIVKFIEGFCCL